MTLPLPRRDEGMVEVQITGQTKVRRERSGWNWHSTYNKLPATTEPSPSWEAGHFLCIYLFSTSLPFGHDWPQRMPQRLLISFVVCWPF